MYNKSIFYVDNISINFGGLKAISSLSFEVKKGEIFAIIGPNGAGKTTVFNIVSGFYKPNSGKVFFEDFDLTRLYPHQIANLGIGRTFQNLELFSEMTIMENLLIAKHLSVKTNILDEIIKSRKTREEEKRIRKEAYYILKYLNLDKYSNDLISKFPFPVQKRIELARALALKPKLLLLDEPAAGLNSSETQKLSTLIKKIRDNFGLTILLVEHDMSMVMNISENICVLDYGEKIAEGKPVEIQNNPKVIEAYLGRGVDSDVRT